MFTLYVSCCRPFPMPLKPTGYISEQNADSALDLVVDAAYDSSDHNTYLRQTIPNDPLNLPAHWHVFFGELLAWSIFRSRRISSEISLHPCEVAFREPRWF